MKLFQFLLSVIVALMLVAPSVFAAVYTVPTAAPTPPTINPPSGPGGPSSGNNNGPPSVSTTEAPAPIATQVPLYGTTQKK